MASSEEVWVLIAVRDSEHPFLEYTQRPENEGSLKNAFAHCIELWYGVELLECTGREWGWGCAGSWDAPLVTAPGYTERWAQVMAGKEPL